MWKASNVRRWLVDSALPDGEEGRERLHARMDHPHWEHVSALAGSMTAEELVDPALALDDLIWRLFHEEPKCAC
jgi:molecular chaperone Hsp33